MSPARKRPEKREPTRPGDDVAEKQDPDHTETEFMHDLDKASRRVSDAKERLDDPSGPGRASPKTSE